MPVLFSLTLQIKAKVVFVFGFCEVHTEPTMHGQREAKPGERWKMEVDASKTSAHP